MSGVNKAIILGRLGRDPEIKYTPSGSAVCTFSVATSDTWKDKNSGEKKERTEWHNITAWNALGENCGKYLSKGQQVYIEGKIQTESWEKDGITRYSTKIIAHQVQFLSGGDGERRPAQQQSRGSDMGYPDPPQAGAEQYDDDIPF